MITKIDLAKALQNSHDTMQKAVDIATENDPIYPPWKIRQILAHLAGWDDAGIAVLRALAAGDVPPTPAERGADIYNAQTVSTRESLNFKQTCQEWCSTREDFIRLVEQMDEIHLTDPIPVPWNANASIGELIGGLANHEKEHAEEVLAILTRK